MQPYQKASEALRSSGEYPINLSKNIGLGLIGGGAAKIGAKAISPLIGHIGSLINEFIPENISKNGLTKLDPRFKKFIDGAIEQGYTYDDVRSFLGNKTNKEITQSKNIIEQYSPELHQFITEKIEQGRSPLEAGALASLERKGSKGFKDVIKKLEKEHNSPFSSILETIYGSMKKSQQQEPQEEESLVNSEVQKANQLYQQQKNNQNIELTPESKTAFNHIMQM